MGRISIRESVQKGAIQQVHTYEDLENHHPSKNFNETGRLYAVVDGEREEVLRERTRNGNLLVSKDFILSDISNSKVQPHVPSPATGYVGAVDPRNGVVRIYDKPGGELIVQIRHMDLRNSELQVGNLVVYGEPLGRQSGFGKGNPDQYGPHVHMDFNAGYIDQFKQYISDIDRGRITTTNYPAHQDNLSRSSVVAAPSNPSTDGVLRHGEHGPEIAVLQAQLNTLGFKDAQGKALVPDGDFGERTKQAVQAFQRAHHLEDDGVIGKDTFAALRKTQAAVEIPSPSLAIDKKETPLLSNPNHPDHTLYKQALAGMEKLPATAFKSDLERQNAAATVVFEAKVSGISRIDNVALSTNGNGLFAVQGGMNDPAHHRIYVDKAQAAAQPVEKSTQQLQQENLLQAQQVQTPEQQKKVMMY